MTLSHNKPLPFMGDSLTSNLPQGEEMSHTILFSILFLIANQSWAQRFDKACDPGDQLMIGAVGDVLLHGPLQKQGYSKGFGSIWSSLSEFIKGPDLMYANLEGPAALGVSKGGKSVKDPGIVFDGSVYSGYPMFNYNPVIVTDLKDSGFDLVSTANNHAMDRGELGVLRTIEALRAHNLPFTGTRTSGDEDFFTVMENAEFKTLWIACTFSTNGLPDKKDLVLDCFDTGRVSQIIKTYKSKVDAVIVTPHWGEEYHLTPNTQQKNFGHQWLEDGALAVIGSHPHVPQTWEKYKTKDGREGLILFSLGNFISNQTSVNKQSSLMLFLGLTKNNGKTWINGVRYLPIYMNRATPYSVVASNHIAKPSAEQKASLKLIKDMYGSERIVEPGEDVITNAECMKN